MRVISIMNLKGGVAKTTSTDNMAYILSKRGYRVLLVDNDKQGDLSRGFRRRTTSGDGINCIMTEEKAYMRNQKCLKDIQMHFHKKRGFSRKEKRWKRSVKLVSIMTAASAIRKESS